jgi:hypothetical protein
MRQGSWRLIAVLAAIAAAGCHHAQNLVPVPERPSRVEARIERPTPPDYRTEEPFALPLSPADSDRISAFLASSGHANTGTNPAASRDYKALLQMLQRNPGWTVEDVLDKNVFKQWLSHAQTGGVVDARLSKAPTFAPIAAKGGQFWWVFYPRGHELTGLIVFLESLPAPQPRRKK